MNGRHTDHVADPRIWYYDYVPGRVRRVLTRFWKKEMRRRDRRAQKQVERDEKGE